MSSASSSLREALSAVLLDPKEVTALHVHGRTKAAVLVALYDGFALPSPQATTSARRHPQLPSPQATTSARRHPQLPSPQATTSARGHPQLPSPQATTSARRHADIHAVFTRRRHDLRSHPGEISFPGGRRDEGDRDLLLTALREAEEEIGLPSEAVRIVGALTPTPTVATSYAVYPFVGVIEPGLAWAPSAQEVDEVLELRLADLRAARDRRRIVHRGIPFRTDVYAIDEGLVIWGATARIVADLLARVDPLLDGAWA